MDAIQALLHGGCNALHISERAVPLPTVVPCLHPDWPATPAQSGRTPLHFACLYGHFEAAKALVRAGADLEARDKVGVTGAWRGRQRRR